MNYTFFCVSVSAVAVLFIICMRFARVSLAGIIIGITTIAYSLINDIAFGQGLGLFYYISPKESTVYMLISAIILYPLLNIIYTMFLPRYKAPAVIYTIFWIIAMFAFEYFSLMTKTIVLTGWKMIPWSVITYIVAYTWIYCFYNYLHKKLSHTYL